MMSEDAEGNAGVLDRGSCKEKSAPEFVVHRQVVAFVQRPDLQRQAQWEQHLRLTDVPALPPYRRDPNQVLERANSPSMHEQRVASRINVDAVPEVEDPSCRPDPGH